MKAGLTRAGLWTGLGKVTGLQARDGWSVEMSCPLSSLGAAHGESLGVNACRFQTRTRRTAVWQAPFEHKPDAFGLLPAPD